MSVPEASTGSSVNVAIRGCLKVQLTLIICGFCVCEFNYLLKFTGNPKINTHHAFMVICRHVQSGKTLSRPVCLVIRAETEQGQALPSCSGSHTVNKCPFRGLFRATFFRFL